MARILIVEDHALVREAMAQTLLHLEAGVECAEASNADDAIALLSESSDWDLAVIDLMLPEMNGFSLLAVMAKRFPDVPAIVVSALDDAASIQRAMKAGASGFVPKASSSSDLLEAIRIVLDGGVYTPTGPGSDGDRRRSGISLAERFGLTTGQMRVCDLLTQGKTNREIADLLGLSEGTVKVHVSPIFKALKVTSRAQALVLINRHGIRL